MARKRTFTLVELLVVVGIIAALLAMLAPTLSRARAQSKLVRCQSNLRTIGHGVQFYLDDNRDFFPGAPFYGCLGYVGRSVYHAVLGSQIPES
ncbi:MAG: type II secretion system protein, partial [Phycisphaerae bacterium]